MMLKTMIVLAPDSISVLEVIAVSRTEGLPDSNGHWKFPLCT